MLSADGLRVLVLGLLCDSRVSKLKLKRLKVIASVVAAPSGDVVSCLSSRAEHLCIGEHMLRSPIVM